MERPNSTPLYPEKLRQIADYIDALGKVEDRGGDPVFPQNGIPVTDNDGTVYGYLFDDIGGEWCFYPKGPS